MERWFRSSRAAVLPTLFTAALGAACSADPSADPRSLVGHDEPSDFEAANTADSADAAAAPGADSLGTPSRFDRNLVMSDELFTASGAADAEMIQSFLERTPYGSASWLANETVSGVRASDAIVAAARAAGINPIVILARMQVEQGLVSKETRPRQDDIDWAFGCGCPDGAACNESFRGLDKQLDCAAATMRRWYDASVDGSGEWERGVSRRSLDGYTIRPASHATASLYAYTPWVLEGRGGNWLVWNVTRRFATHLADQGLLLFPVGDGAPALAMTWTQGSSGRHTFTFSAPAEVASVELRVDGFVLGTAARTADGPFDTLDVGFTVHKPSRVLEARGLDAEGKLLAFSVGLIDTTTGAGVYVQPLGGRRVEIGVDRAPSAVAAIEVTLDGRLITDDVSGETHSTRRVVAQTLAQLGEREIAVTTYDADGGVRGTLRRTFRFR